MSRNPPLSHLHLKLLQLFSDTDNATQKFSSWSGLRCPEGCGSCCEKPVVHTSAIELIPLAQHLFSQGSAEEWYRRAKERGPGICVFYEPHGGGKGRCSVYPLRPLVCRLFGFAAVRDKYGTPQLAACVVHRQHQPEAVARAEAAVREGAPIPIFHEIALQAAQVDPGRASALIPINQALCEAIEIIFFKTAASQDMQREDTPPAEVIPLPAARRAGEPSTGTGEISPDQPPGSYEELYPKLRRRAVTQRIAQSRTTRIRWQPSRADRQDLKPSPDTTPRRPLRPRRRRCA